MARRQRGAALLIAMIIVALIATLASSMVWQQWRAVQVETAERSRTQSAWILAGALDWARLILKEDARSGGADHLGEPWAVPLAEARLSTFLAADKDNTDEGPDAFLSGAITDAQARFNLTNVVVGGEVVGAELAALKRLFDAVGVAPEVADVIATGLRRATLASAATTDATGAVQDLPLLPRSISQLGWLGVDAPTLRMLEPYVVLLPFATPININTAPREVLVGAVNGLDLATAVRLVQVRQRTPFKSLADIQHELPAIPAANLGRLSVASSFFEVRGRLRLGAQVLEQRSLVERRGLNVIVLQREKVSSRDLGGN